ncbi:MAG: hypothetical protein K2Q09_11490, partial [Phycisphaerales bacterium]|nr:hypothetical protein [Phycisphaerales bacterium]
MAVFPAFLFIPISAGGTMVVPPIDFARQGPAQVDSAALIQVINDCKVGSFFAAPILIENLASEALARNLTMPSLKRVIGAGAAGDALGGVDGGGGGCVRADHRGVKSVGGLVLFSSQRGVVGDAVRLDGAVQIAPVGRDVA